MSEAPTRAPWKRCFIALAPDAASRDALATLAVPPNARRVPYEQLHLTVAFIGALSVEQGETLAQRLSEHAGPFPPAQVTNIECWPGRAKPRLMVAVLAMSDAFVALDWRVRSQMFEVGLSLDARAFRPHVTLARHARALRARRGCGAARVRCARAAAVALHVARAVLEHARPPGRALRGAGERGARLSNRAGRQRP